MRIRQKYLSAQVVASKTSEWRGLGPGAWGLMGLVFFFQDYASKNGWLSIIALSCSFVSLSLPPSSSMPSSSVVSDESSEPKVCPLHTKSRVRIAFRRVDLCNKVPLLDPSTSLTSLPGHTWQEALAINPEGGSRSAPSAAYVASNTMSQSWAGRYCLIQAYTRLDTSPSGQTW